MELRKHINLDALFSPDYKHAANLCGAVDEDDVKRISVQIQDGYNADVQSRYDWVKRNALAMNLALQVKENKTSPWMNCSNVKFPLVTVAALQYQARAYPALINDNDLVKHRVWGEDPDGEKHRIADRRSAHMSWQLLEQDEDWEEETAALFLIQAITGNVYRKKVFDPVRGRIISRLVLPSNFVTNYYTKSIRTSPRYTEIFYLTPNEIRQRQLDGRFVERDLPLPQVDTNKSELDIARDRRQGINEPPADSATPCNTGEQYCWLDLDGDEFEEPYIVTFDLSTGQVWRIVPRFSPKRVKRRNDAVYEIEAIEVYKKYGFVPSPDGGFYDLGMGALLGPINDSVNTAFNQAFDAMSMKTMGGGFVGRGFKSKSGTFTFAPNTWHPLDTPGDDIRKNIMPLPVADPPALLLQMVQFLVAYAERIVSATDLQVGENIGQNTPAETSRTMDTNGSRVYSSLWKGTWRAFKGELRLQEDLNSLFLEEDKDFEFLTKGATALIRPDDYRQGGISISPAADPHVVSDTQAVQQAAFVADRAFSVPGHNKYKAQLRLYKAMKIPAIDEVFPPPMQQNPQTGQMEPAQDIQMPPNYKMVEAQAKAGAMQWKQKEGQARLMMEAEELTVGIEKTRAEIAKLLAEAKATAADPVIKLIFAQIESSEKHRDRILEAAKMLGEWSMQGAESGSSGSGGGNGRGTGAGVQAASGGTHSGAGAKRANGEATGPMA